MTALLAALVLAAIPCSKAREDCAASCQAEHSKDWSCRNAAGATYDKCARGCEKGRHTAEDNQLCVNTCKSTKDTADRECQSKAFDCIDKCVSAKHCT